MQFKAALFDMDGTLLDSMGVWAQVDEDFFSIRGINVPDDYGPNLAGKSFMQSAEYTKERFGLPESCEEIVAEWNALCRVQYEQHVPLKPGAAAYLRLLKRHGVKIAAATALPEHLFMPALKRTGIAARLGLSSAGLARDNGLFDPDVIFPGQTLRIVQGETGQPA